MAKLIITTQVLENYGSLHHPFWKAKGGNDYVVKNFTHFSSVNRIVADLRNQIEADHPYFQEYVRSWEVVDDDYLTDFEQSQLKYEGRITYPAQELVIA